MEFEVVQNEEEYVQYLTEPDHKQIGSALTKKYTKDLKEKLNKLDRAEVVEYIKNGQVNVNGVDILEGWLKISK